MWTDREKQSCRKVLMTELGSRESCHRIYKAQHSLEDQDRGGRRPTAKTNTVLTWKLILSQNLTHTSNPDPNTSTKNDSILLRRNSIIYSYEWIKIFVTRRHVWTQGWSAKRFAGLLVYWAVKVKRLRYIWCCQKLHTVQIKSVRLKTTEQDGHAPYGRMASGR